MSEWVAIALALALAVSSWWSAVREAHLFLQGIMGGKIHQLSRHY